MTEVKEQMLEWQAASGSPTLHLIDTSVDGWHTPAGARRRSGPRAACGKYPQRNADGVWLSFPATETEEFESAAKHYLAKWCWDCRIAVTCQECSAPLGTRHGWGCDMVLHGEVPLDGGKPPIVTMTDCEED